MSECIVTPKSAFSKKSKIIEFLKKGDSPDLISMRLDCSLAYVIRIEKEYNLESMKSIHTLVEKIQIIKNWESTTIADNIIWLKTYLKPALDKVCELE